MSNNQEIERAVSQKTFEDIKHVTKEGLEFWFARELQSVLGYKEWRNFLLVIAKAQKAIESTGTALNDHFVEVNKIIEAGVTNKTISDYALTRYACYLIAQNGDSSKQPIAEAQTYFAIQTRKQEELEQLSEEEKRVYVRNQVKTHNSKLAKTADNFGVVNFGEFNDWGYMGLYGWKRASQIKKKKGIKGTILDYAGTTELAANLFRITQTDDRLKKDSQDGKSGQNHANTMHFNVGKIVRNSIKDIGGTMPEDLSPEEDIKKVERRVKKQEKIKSKKPLELEKLETDEDKFKRVLGKAAESVDD